MYIRNIVNIARFLCSTAASCGYLRVHACSDYETPQLTAPITATNGTEIYARLRQSTRPVQADADSPGVSAAGNNDYEIPIPSEIAPLPPRVHAYENTPVM